MIRVTRARDLGATPDEVWALLSDLGGLSRWAPGIDHASLMGEQSSGVGATRRVQARRLVLVERVDTWEPGLMFGYTIDGLPPFVATARNTWTIRRAEDGASVAVITDVTADRGIRRLASRVVAWRLGNASTAMLAGLARHLEEDPRDE